MAATMATDSETIIRGPRATVAGIGYTKENGRVKVSTTASDPTLAHP